MTLLQHEHAGPGIVVIIIPGTEHPGRQLQNNLPGITLYQHSSQQTVIYSLDGLGGEDRGVCPPFEDVVQEPALASDAQREAGDQERGEGQHGIVRAGHRFNVIPTLTPG